MIKAEKGAVQIKGDVVIVLGELTSILAAVKQNLISVNGEEFARAMIAECGRLAFLDEEELKKESDSATDELVKRLGLKK